MAESTFLKLSFQDVGKVKVLVDFVFFALIVKVMGAACTQVFTVSAIMKTTFPPVLLF